MTQINSVTNCPTCNSEVDIQVTTVNHGYYNIDTQHYVPKDFASKLRLKDLTIRALEVRLKEAERRAENAESLLYAYTYA